LKKNKNSSHKLPKQQSTNFWSQGILGVKKRLLIELCDGNYAMFDGIVICADRLFKASTTCLDKSIMWIIFSNTKAGTFTKEKSSHLFTDEIENDKTSIEPLIKEIRVGIIQSHLIIRIKFLV
jgi:hypothetical protein